MNTEALPPETHAASFGSRLRAAREARGLDLESCGHALKLPVRVLRQLESDQHEGIDHQIYLGSYIGKYARHLGVDEAAIQAELARIKRAGAEPALVATGGISHSRYLLERYATAATYVVLTAVIVVPVIWLGVRGTLDRDMSHLAPLDATPVVQQDAPARAGSAMPPVAVPAQRADAPAQGDGQPLMASMAPFPNLGSETLQAAKPQASAAEAGSADAGGHVLGLSLAEASWVEVVDGKGTRLEYGLLPAGSNKTYRSGQPLDVRIGNAEGAQVSIDGQPVALDGYRRANVAHFRVQLQDGKAVPAGM
nr:helix-turn-helix domain-containing protein [Fulvimonas soli]